MDLKHIWHSKGSTTNSYKSEGWSLTYFAYKETLEDAKGVISRHNSKK